MAIVAAALSAAIGLTSPAPASAALAWSNPVLLTPDGLTGVACPTVSQCTAVGGYGQEFTFNPSAPGDQSSAAVDQTGGVMQAVACPTASQCTAVDDQGYQTTFNPQSPGSTTQVRIAQTVGLVGIACPTASQCTAVGSQYEVTFDPDATTVPAEISVDPGSMIDGSGGIMGIACPTASLCIAADYVGQEVSFDPSSPGTPSPTTVDPGNDNPFWYPPGNTPPNALEGVSCPIAEQCTAVAANGGEATFDPASAASPTPAPSTLLTNSPLFAVACPTSTRCVAVGHNDRWAFALEGDPQSGPPWFVEPLSGMPAPTAVACPTTSVCVAVDYSGHEATGTFVPGAPAPINDALPDLDDSAAEVPGGTVAVGQTLTATPGTWFNAPSAFAYQWDDCDSTGTNCVPIHGATGQTYTLTAADVGHMIRLDEIATNAGGSTKARSWPWALVRAADDPGSGDGGSGSDSGSSGDTAESGGTGTGEPASSATLTVGGVRVHGSAAEVEVRCAGMPGTAWVVRITLTPLVRGKGSPRVVAVGAHGLRRRAVAPISAGGITAIVPAGRSRVLCVSLNAFARRLLGSHARLRVRVAVAGGSTTMTLQPLASRMLAFTRRHRARAHRMSRSRQRVGVRT